MGEPERTVIERLAHHLAVQAGGAGEDWHAHIDEASGILAVIKDPDADMRAAGDETVWRAMIDAALVARAGLGPDTAPAPPPPAGTDEEGDVPLPDSSNLKQDPASWVQQRKAD